MKRRSFLQKTAIGAPVVLQGVQTLGMPQFGIFSNLGTTDKILVIIQLNGGNDGLNTLIPLDQYSNLTNARTDIILDENEALKLEDHVGLHPMMSGMHEMYKEGLLSIVQATGYPNQNRSHFRSKDIWMTASPSEDVYLTGWLGRHMEQEHPTFPINYPSPSNPDPIAIAIGSSATKTCQGTVANFSLAVNNPQNASIIPLGLTNTNLQGVYGDRMDYLQSTYRQTNEYGEIISEAYETGSDQSQYYTDLATNRLSQQMNIVGQLIDGGLETKVYVVQLGGFDTHGDQSEAGDSTSGRHPVLLDQLSQAIRGFQKHVDAIGKSKKVLGMTFSEFGRRIKSNGSYGTDHGSAAPLFLFGECVKGGVLGDNPEIGDTVTDQEGVAMQHDFRSVYGTIMKDWFELEEDNIKSLLTEEIQFLPFLEPCFSTSSDDQAYQETILKVSPSPAAGRIKIEFESFGEEVHLGIFDALGHQVTRLSPQQYATGFNDRYVNVANLPHGAYFIRYQSGQLAKTVRFIKS